MIYTNEYESPLGNILLAGDDQGLTGLWFTEGGRYIGLGLKKGAVRRETDYFTQAKEWLKEVSKAFHRQGILRIVITPFLIGCIQIAGRGLAVLMEGEVPLGCQELENVVRVLHNSINVVL